MKFCENKDLTIYCKWQLNLTVYTGSISISFVQFQCLSLKNTSFKPSVKVLPF